MRRPFRSSPARYRKSDGKSYMGERVTTARTPLVTVDAAPLNPRLDLLAHEPDGFEWGYGGAGAAQLALALLADATGNDAMALEFYQRFKWAVIANLPYEGWFLTQADILEKLAQIREDDEESTDSPLMVRVMEDPADLAAIVANMPGRKGGAA